MLGLVPVSVLEPYFKVDYQSLGELSEGKLLYEEKIGEETIETRLTLTDQEVIDRAKLEKGQSTIHMSRDYIRCITIRFFPTEAIARRTLERISEL